MSHSTVTMVLPANSGRLATWSAAHTLAPAEIPTSTPSVPVAMRGKLEPAELFHEILEHRWYMAELAGSDIRIEDATVDYVANVLPTKPEEKSVLGTDTTEMPILAGDTAQARR